MGRWLTPHHNRGSLADGQHVRSPASGLILAQSACCHTAAGTRTCGLPLCAQSVGLRPCPLEVRVRSQPAGTFRRVVSVPAPLRASCQWSTYPQGSPRLLVIDGFFALRNACVLSLQERCSTWKAADASNSIWGPTLAAKTGPKTCRPQNANKKETNGIHENVAPNWEPKLTSKRGVDIAAFGRKRKRAWCGYQHDSWKGKKQSASFLYIATYSGGTLTWSWILHGFLTRF